MFSLRLWYRWRARNNKIVLSRRTPLEMILLTVAFIGMLLIPLIYLFTPRLDFADYQLPPWTAWVGTLLFLPALWLLWRSHADLGHNWSETLEVRKGHELITKGVYKQIRHPMYAAILLWGLAQPWLLHNWMAGWSHLVSFLPLYLLRVPHEETLMNEQFGEAYHTYMQRTGRIFSHLFKKQH